jgi:hypothetical protein
MMCSSSSKLGRAAAIPGLAVRAVASTVETLMTGTDPWNKKRRKGRKRWRIMDII